MIQIARKGTEKDPFYNKNGDLIESISTSSRLYSPLPILKKEIVSVSGCGDCLAAGIICGIHHNMDEINCVKFALKAADLSIKSFDPVPPTLATLRNNIRSSSGTSIDFLM